MGEYNKNSSDPEEKLDEVLHDTAFDRHTYKHTTMGFLKDVQDMPSQYDYSLKFFDRYYRPEYTTIVVAGDVDPKNVRALVDQYWGGWKRGSYHPDIPVEPAQQGARENHIDWPSPTLPLIDIAFHGPAYSDTSKEWAELDALATWRFAQFRPESVVANKGRYAGRQHGSGVDPNCGKWKLALRTPAICPTSRTDSGDIKRFQDSQWRPTIGRCKNRRRYAFAGLDNSQSVAAAAPIRRIAAIARQIDKLYSLYSQLTPADIKLRREVSHGE